MDLTVEWHRRSPRWLWARVHNLPQEAVTWAAREQEDKSNVVTPREFWESLQGQK